MASYSILPPNKQGQPRIKLFAEFGYDASGKRLRKMKTVTLDKLTESNILNAIAQSHIRELLEARHDRFLWSAPVV